MGMCYWAIYGLGVEIDEEIFIENEDLTDQELVQERLGLEHTPIDYITDGCDRAWVIYTPTCIFHMTDKEKSFTCEQDVAKEMYRALKPILLPTIGEEWFIDHIDYVNDYGAS